MRTLLIAVVFAGASFGVGQAEASNLEDGEKRYNVNCVNCHGKQGKGMASFPSIAGRDYDYISERLSTYRSKEMVGPNSAIMMSLVEELSDDEISNLSAYISQTFP